MQLATIDLDPIETKIFAKSSLAIMREKGSNTFANFKLRNLCNAHLFESHYINEVGLGMCEICAV